MGMNKQTSLKYVLEAIKARQGSAMMMQSALEGVVYQIVSNGNPDWLSRVIRGLSRINHEGKVLLSHDARQVWKYVVEGLGLPIKWDKEKQTVQMAQGWKEKCPASEAINKTLDYTRWDMYDTKKADKEFDEDKKVAAFVSGLINKGNVVEKEDFDRIMGKVRKVWKQKKDAA